MEATAGGAIQFAPVWTVTAPMAAETRIRYCIGADTPQNSVRSETLGFFRDRVPYVEAEVGRTYVDAVTLPVPDGMQPGSYPLIATNAATGETLPESVDFGSVIIER